MKNNSIKNIFKLIPAFLALISGVFLFSSKSVSAETLTSLPDYFSVYTATYQDGTYTKQTGTFENDNAFFVKDNEAVVLEFDEDKLKLPNSNNLRISQEISYVINYNDNVISTSLDRQSGFDISNDKIFSLKINPSLATSSTSSFEYYGKYTITFSYQYLNDAYDPEYKTFTCNFYVFNHSDYFNSKTFSPTQTSNKSPYYYNYSSTNKLFNLEYDYTKFNVTVTKVYQQISNITELKNVNGEVTITNYDELSAVSNKSCVKFDYLYNTETVNGKPVTTKTDKARITFNDLGTYYITYETIFGNGEVFNSYYLPASDIEILLNDTVNIFGVQSFYTGQNGLEEFKQINFSNSSNVLQQADVTGIVGTSNENITAENISAIKGQKIVSTNQAPVYFTTNASIDSSNSCYWIFDSVDAFNFKENGTLVSNGTQTTNYTNTPLSMAGVYLVKLAYTYSTTSATAITYYQWFCFEITTSSPQIEIKEIVSEQDANNNGKIDDDEREYSPIPTDYVTYNNVFVTKKESGVFDSPATLKVYKALSFNSSDLELENLSETVNSSKIFEDSAKYKVELTYGNKGQKKYISYFTIDKTGITDITINTTTKITNTTYRKDDQTLDSLFTNQAVAISWNNKEAVGKAQTYAEYKYFPTQFSLTLSNSLSSEEIRSIYNSPYTKNGIVSTDLFTYTEGTLPVSTYANTIGLNSLSEGRVLSDSGLYIIRIYDQTANVKEVVGENVIYKVIFIDKTKTNIISVDDNIWSYTSNAKTTTKDYTLYFGEYKLVKLISEINGTDKEVDPWLKDYVLNNEEIKNNYFTHYKGDIYFKINNLKYVWYNQNTNGLNRQIKYFLSETNNYGMTINAIDNTGNPNESQYIFYIGSTSNSKINDSFDSFNVNYNVNHMVTFTTDNSKMTLSYKNQDGNVWNLQQVAVEKVETTKYNFYQPTAKNTLSNSNEVLDFSYVTEPSALLSVNSIKLDYYAFEKGTNGTYIFKNDPSATFDIYNKTGIQLGSIVAGEANTFTWKLNVETIQGQTRTKAGKYVITREYVSSSDANDPKTRVLTFIVDRNGIISEPEVNQSGNSVYYTGGSIKLQVLNNYQSINSTTLFFNDIYYANQMSQNSGTHTPVLVTNLLPVTIYVPAFKYGYDNVSSKNIYSFIEEPSIIEYGSDTKNKHKFDGYKLTATVKYRKSNNLSTKVDKTTILNTTSSNNYLTSLGEGKGLDTFKDEGYYRVIIESNAGDTFTFDFQIKYESPDYSLLDENNNPLAEKSGTYYTNKSKIRIAWEDSESSYLANINQDEIKYTIEGYSGEEKIDSNLVQGSGNSHYVDLDLTNYGDLNGKKINITLQFKGNESDYDKSYFSKTTTVVIDTDAPITNLKELIKQTGLSFGDLREYASGNKYNISKNTGLFANYSFVIDKDNFKNFLKTPEETGYDFYKVYYTIFEKDGLNTKYVLGNSQESDITLENYSDILTNVLNFINNGSNFDKLFSDNTGKYIEIVEEDYAGNRTVYTVFVTDLKGDEGAIKYKALTSSSKDNEIEIKYSDLQKNQGTNFETSIDIRSKHSLNLEEVNLLNAKAYLNDKYYQLISVNGEMFVKTPFSDEYFYKVSEFTSTENSPRYTLKDLTSLKSNSFAQNIIIYSVPIFGKITLNAYVLNKTLEYSTLSSFENDESKEGITVKLPGESSDTNIIYCEELTIKCVIGGNTSTIVVNNETKHYFKEEQEIFKSDSFEISYVSGLNNSKYFKLEITRNINKNDYFVYTLIDNFGDVSKIYHIFGQIDIKEPITSEENIVSSYDEQGTYIHYSSSDITYKYDSTIYSGDTTVTVTNQGTTYSYIITKNGSTITVTENNSTVENYTIFFECELINGSIMALKLKASKIDFASGALGSNLKFTVKLTLNDDFKTDGENENIEKTFVTYNKVPKITLLGANDDDVTYILGNKGIYTNKIKVNIENTVLDFPYEVYIITPSNLSILLTEEYTAEENGTYYLVINYLGDISGVSKKLAFTIKNSSDFKFSVMKINSDGSYSEIERTGNPYSYDKQNGTIIEQNHYITNANYTILLNESLNLVCDRVETVDEYTSIYVIHTDYNIQTATEYYSCRIAVTKIPETNSIFNEKGFIKYETDGSSVDLVKLSSDVSSVFTKTGFEQGKKLAWSKYYLIPENKINVTVYYNEIDKALFTPEIVENDNLYTTTLKSSGIYFFKFSDLAGNVHFFGTYKEQEYFSMQYLSSVIFEVNEESPINYAIYDREVAVSVPLHTLNLYDSNARPVINVEFNGKPLDVKTTNSYSWTFTKEGLYKIWFTAKIGGETIYEAPTYFTILSSEESRLSFSFISYENCYIEDILRNGTSIYSKLANANSGNLYNNKYLKDVIIHINDIKTGAGVYTFVVNANNEFGQKYTFTIWINNPNVPIIISHESGTTTDKNITITFTSSNVLNEVGDCILKITGQEDIYITKELLESGTLSELNEIVLSQSREYYIEVTTLSGQLLFSSYINKVEPLNTVSIILITTACVVAVAGVVLFLLLRKKMRIK